MLLLKLVCARQSCNQIISGRNLRYNRALQIVQNEEYLDVADLSILRRSKRQNNDYAGYLDIDSNSGVTTLDQLCSATNVNAAFQDNCAVLLKKCMTAPGCTFNNVITGASVTLSNKDFVAQCIQYSTDQFNLLCPIVTAAPATSNATNSILDT